MSAFKAEGEFAEAALISATLTFRYQGKEYTLEEKGRDVGGKPWEAQDLNYIWTEGNFSCDDNRSIFLSQKYEDVEELHECGHQICLYSIAYVTDQGSWIDIHNEEPE